MVNAKLLKSLAHLSDPPGTRKDKKPITGEDSRNILGGGVSKLAFVHRPSSEGSSLWTIRFLQDGYSFRLGLRNRVLAGFVSRLIHAATDPEALEKGCLVNGICEESAPETIYLAHAASVFEIRLPDSPEDDSDTPGILIVDDWAAKKIRGYSWFECNQKGMPKSRAVSPVVSVRRDAREIKVTWITIESVIISSKGILPKRKRVERVGYSSGGGRYADLRFDKPQVVFKVGHLPQSRKFYRKATKKEEDVIAPYRGDKKLPREGDTTIRRTVERWPSVVVTEGVDKNYVSRPYAIEWDKTWA